MITIEIMGGLGNQLFQIFTLISYCSIYRKNYQSFIYFENRPSNRILYRPYYWDNFLKSLKPLLRNTIHNIPILKEPTFNYTKIPIVNNDSFKLYGYFQSYKYFENEKENIFKMIKLKEQKEDIKIDCDNKVSLHFRMGDYKKLQQYHPILSINYYINAIDKLIKDTNKNDWNIIYFYEKEDEVIVNDRINILKEKYKYIIFEPINEKYKDYEQMLIMSKCNHNIIANSSFSWWGAYFNENKNKNVYYPDVWFGEKIQKNTKDLFPSEWLKITNYNNKV